MKVKSIIFHICIIIGLFVSVIVYENREFNLGCENIRENTLRLHVIANSDSDEDQRLKLKVRDAVTQAGKELFSSCKSREEATKIAENEKEYLKCVAENVILKSGKNYPVSVLVGKENYPVRTYNTVTLPAGEYTSLRIIIGAGTGKNWWCVVFPPMCVSAAGERDRLEEVLNEKGMKVVSSDEKYEIRFKIFEWYEDIKTKITDSLEKK